MQKNECDKVAVSHPIIPILEKIYRLAEQINIFRVIRNVCSFAICNWNTIAR
jgi:hypothetical protein